MAYDIFVSYRRKDCAGLTSGTNIARTIKQQLEIEGYKHRVFFDYSELSDDDFEKIILKAIERCKVFILVLSRDSMMRCVNDDDWVRREILHAQKRGLKIIPVEPDNLFNGYPDEFPAELDIVKRIQHTTIHMDSSFERDMRAMIEARIRPILTEGGVVPIRGAIVKIDSDLECRVLDFGEMVGTIGKGINEIRLPKGNHELSFVGVESDAERFDYGELDIRDLEYITRIKVRLLDQYNARKEEEIQIEQSCRLSGKGRDGVYKVGDYYDDGKKQGVVFEVTPDGKHGKIVKGKVSRHFPWSSDENEQIRLIGADDQYNGANNMAMVQRIAGWREKYPAFAWCANWGEDWYLPAYFELRSICKSRNILNETFAKKNYFGGIGRTSFWSSTECNKLGKVDPKYLGQYNAWYLFVNDVRISRGTFEKGFPRLCVLAVSAF